jgi:O-antigen/teichoic acid export membrane protein
MPSKSSGSHAASLSNKRRVFSRVSWTVVDQGFSALSNLFLSVLVARSATADGFGAFAVAFLVYSLVVGFSRAFIGTPLQISYSSCTSGELRKYARLALGAAVIFGTAAALLSVIAGIALRGESGFALIALGIWFPALLLQDTCRMAFFAEGTPKRAAIIDAAWGAIVLGGFAVALAAGAARGVEIPLTLWGLGSAVSAIWGMRMLRVGPRPRGGIGWMREQFHISRFLGGEFALTIGIVQAGILMVGFVATQAGVGAIRAAQVLLGPTNVLFTAAFMFTTTEVARTPKASPRHRFAMANTVSAALAMLIGLYVAMLLVLPDSVGNRLLGDTWSGASTVLLPMCIVAFVGSMNAGPWASLYGMGRTRTTFRVNVVRAVVTILLLTVGVIKWHAVGAAWALAITEIVLLPVVYVVWISVTRKTAVRMSSERESRS